MTTEVIGAYAQYCEKKYSPDQARDERGRFGAGSGAALSASAAAEKVGGGHNATNATRAAKRAVEAEKAGNRSEAMNAHAEAANAHAAAAHAASTDAEATAHQTAAAAHGTAYRKLSQVGRRLDVNPAAHRSIVY